MIGSKVIGSGVVAGQLGIINPEHDLIEFEQTVRFHEIEPAADLIIFEQSVAEISPAQDLITFQQRVVEVGETAKPPQAYVWINGVDYSSSTERDTVRVSRNEDQSATASIFVFWPMEAEINIPAFHGKPIRIEVHEDPLDASSPVFPLFTGWIETAKHNRAKRGIDFTCSDLRDERLGDEDGGQIKALTGALFSSATQQEDATGRDYVAELMKTVCGSIGYNRAGGLSFYTWGVEGKATNRTLINSDVLFADPTTEFQTRSTVINRVTINIDYRYSMLRAIATVVDAYKPRNYDPPDGGYRDHKAFRRDEMIDKAQSFSPWETLRYEIYDLERAYNSVAYNFNYIFVDQVYAAKDSWSQGFKSELVRRVAQPVTESYKIVISAPQSVDAYGKAIDGSEAHYSIDTEYDGVLWEDEFSHKAADKGGEVFGGQVDEASNTGEFVWLTDPAEPAGASIDNTSLAERIAAERAAADNKRAELAAAFNAAYAIGKKEIVTAHRQSYVSATINSIIPVDLGQVIEHNNRIVQATGQCTGIEYTIGDGIRHTTIRAAISYMDTAVTAPVDNWSEPMAPTKPAADLSLESEVNYRSWGTKAFEVSVAEIPADYTDELEPTVESAIDLPLEINAITLINGF